MPHSSANQCKSTLPKVTSKPRKPGRRTLLRIRYYEMKIRLSDMYVGIRYFFTKSKLTKCHEGRKASCNNESTECPDEDDNSMREASDGEMNKLHPDLKGGSIKVNREARSSTTDMKQNRSRQRKRRSSLTRRNSEAESVVSTKSYASGDVNFSDCDEEELKSSQLKLKKTRQSKSSKLIKVKSEGEVGLENIADRSDNGKTIEDVNSHKAADSSHMSPLPSQTPTTNLQAKLQKAYSAAETKTKAPKKSLKQRFAELSNRKRPRDMTQAPPKVFKFGFKANLPKGTVRQRNSVCREDDPEIATPRNNLITGNANLQGGIISPHSFLVDVNNQNYSYPNRFILKDDISNKSTTEKSEGKFATILKQFSNFGGLSSTSKASPVAVDNVTNYPANFSNPYDQIHTASSAPQTFRAAKDVRESITNHFDIFPKYDPLISRYFRFTDDRDLTSEERSGPGISRSLDTGTSGVDASSYKPKTQFTSQFYNLLAPPDSFS